MFNERLWKEAYTKAIEETKDMPVTVTSRTGWRGNSPIVFIIVAVKGNKTVIDKLKSMGWITNRNINDQGSKMREMGKIY